MHHSPGFYDLFADQLRDLYQVETQLHRALPDSVEAANTRALKEMFAQDLVATGSRIAQLRHMFDWLAIKSEGHLSPAIRGLIEKCYQVIRADYSQQVHDAGLIASVQRITHYQLTGYRTARAFAEILDDAELAQRLQYMLDEKVRADRMLNVLAEDILKHNTAERSAGW